MLNYKWLLYKCNISDVPYLLGCTKMAFFRLRFDGREKANCWNRTEESYATLKKL